MNPDACHVDIAVSLHRLPETLKNVRGDALGDTTGTADMLDAQTEHFFLSDDFLDTQERADDEKVVKKSFENTFPIVFFRLLKPRLLEFANSTPCKD